MARAWLPWKEGMEGSDFNTGHLNCNYADAGWHERVGFGSAHTHSVADVLSSPQTLVEGDDGLIEVRHQQRVVDGLASREISP